MNVIVILQIEKNEMFGKGIIHYLLQYYNDGVKDLH